jgi:hypothetical protein
VFTYFLARVASRSWKPRQYKLSVLFVVAMCFQYILIHSGTRQDLMCQANIIIKLIVICGIRWFIVGVYAGNGALSFRLCPRLSSYGGVCP